MDNIRTRPHTHLLNILGNTRKRHPDFALFLGAGASRSSGVKLASEMVEEWRLQLFQQQEEHATLEVFLGAQPWYKRPDEYGCLFEAVYDQPSQRRDYIEKCLSKAKPSWGYIYLVNLLLHRIFDIVCTTNFDDLVQESCYTFSSAVRPLVCAHDSSIRGLRLTYERPKVIKLHGDFLFDSIKNTPAETSRLEANMRDKFKQIASEFGMVFVGYSGNDKSVMDVVGELLEDGTYFKHGIYWCVLKESDLSPYVIELAKNSSFHLITIDGFDEFMAEMHERFGISLPAEVAAPYQALADRLDNLVRQSPLYSGQPRHYLIERDINNLGSNITLMLRACVPSQEAESYVQSELSSPAPMPFRLLADIEVRKENHLRAVQFLIQDFKQRPSISPIEDALEIAVDANLRKESYELVQLALSVPGLLAANPDGWTNAVLSLLKLGLYDQAQLLTDAMSAAVTKSGGLVGHGANYFVLNVLQIKRHRNIELSKSDIADLEKLKKDKDVLTKMGAAILLQEYAEAEQLIMAALATNALGADDLSWPIFRLIIPYVQDSSLQEIFQQCGLAVGQVAQSQVAGASENGR